MTYETLDVTCDSRGVVYVTLNRPEKRNAISAAMMAELTSFAQTVGSDRDTRAIVLAGHGSVFCAGGDLDWMRAQIAADRATRIKAARCFATMLDALNTMPTPLIARIHGAAMGGGVGIASICDVAIAETGARFGLTETRLGLIPATIGPYVIARMGEGCARRVFMSSRVFHADEAVELNLISKHVASDDLDTAIEAEVVPYLTVAPGAVGAAKSLARRLGPTIDPDVMEDTIHQLADIWEQEEARHGLDAFLEKRAPRWAAN